MELAGSQGAHDGIKDSELSGGKGSNHDATRHETDRAQIVETNFLGNVHETLGHGTFATGALLVDLGKEGIGRVRNNGSGNSRHDTGEETDSKSRRGSDFGRLLAHGNVHVVGDITLDYELGARVGDLLGENGTKARVESSDPFGLGHLGKAITETAGPSGVRDGSDSDRFQGAEKDIGNEFGTRGRGNVNRSLVIPSLLFPKGLRGVDLEEFDSSELEPSLDKVPNGGGTEACGQGHGSFFGNDLLESSNQSPVVLLSGKKRAEFFVGGWLAKVLLQQ